MSDVTRIAYHLGGKKLLGREPKSTADLVEVISEGLPYASLEKVAARLGLERQEDLEQVLGIPRRTLTRRATEGRLEPRESELAVRLARMAQRAEEVLEDMERAYRFLREPNEELGGKRPIDMVRTDIGTQMVEDVLNRIDYGVYA